MENKLYTPWQVSDSGHQDFDLCITASDGGSVCHITKWFNQEESAKLIASAPELLEAVSSLIDPSTGKVWIEIEKHLRLKDKKLIESSYQKATK